MLSAEKEISFNSLFDKINKSFQQKVIASKKLKNKAVHDLRVDIKYLRALLRLAEHFCPVEKISKTILKQVRPVFRSAGKMRTASVNSKLIRQIKGSSTYFAHLKKTEKTAGKKLIRAVNTLNFPAFKKNCAAFSKVISPVQKEVVVSESLKYIHQKKVSIKKSIKQKVYDTTLHEIRKELKIIKATLQILFHITAQKLFKSQIRSLTLLEETIGNWHDQVVLYEDLNVFNTQHKTNKKLIMFAANLYQENNMLKNNVLVLLKDYLK